ncbi:MAG: hypothetical protein SGI87_10300 [Flavobacteriales bacterium]|nr:hypothetical protein [Flavobacteriales bacterium]
MNPLDNLPPGSVINNTAEIHFDENPAIVTNTTYHTIFDCASFTGTTGDLEFCEGDNALLSAEQEYAETYTWSINDEAAGAGSTIHLGNLIAVVYNIGVYVENPLCGSTSEEILLVLENPTANAGEDQEICFGESAILEASGGDEYEWNNGLGNGPEHTVSPETYTSYIVTASNILGCYDVDAVTVIVHDLPETIITESGSTLAAPDGST